jgi:hypothetical protein
LTGLAVIKYYELRNRSVLVRPRNADNWRNYNQNLKTRVSVTDIGLNDFGMDLLNYAKTSGDLDGVSSGMRAVLPPHRIAPCPQESFSVCEITCRASISTSRTAFTPKYLICVDKATGGVVERRAGSVQPLHRRDDHPRQHHQRLDDFELIAFLMVR